jgi:hypothetical protein
MLKNFPRERLLLLLLISVIITGTITFIMLYYLLSKLNKWYHVREYNFVSTVHQDSWKMKYK